MSLGRAQLDTLRAAACMTSDARGRLACPVLGVHNMPFQARGPGRGRFCTWGMHNLPRSAGAARIGRLFTLVPRVCVRKSSRGDSPAGGVVSCRMIAAMANAGPPVRRLLRGLEGVYRNWTNVRLRELQLPVAFRHRGAVPGTTRKRQGCRQQTVRGSAAGDVPCHDAATKGASPWVGHG